jgi:Lrp/AsnC family leucine-responsive transcriptional regulator
MNYAFFRSTFVDVFVHITSSTVYSFDEWHMNDRIVHIDPTDLRVLEQLQADASLTNQALAERVHVSPATCLRRVKRLVETGVIERRIAILSPERLGIGLTALVELTLDRQGAEHLAAFEARAVAEPAVQQCYRVSPGPDFMLVLHVADMPAYHALVQRLFTQDANVRNVKAFFSVSRAKFEPRIVL